MPGRITCEVDPPRKGQHLNLILGALSVCFTPSERRRFGARRNPHPAPRRLSGVFAIDGPGDSGVVHPS